jgi:hypothetical protein
VNAWQIGLPALGEMQVLLTVKTSFIRITLGLSEAAARSPDVGARRVREMVRPEPAKMKATTV